MILNWLRRRLFNKRRLIFRFFDGTRRRGADPLEVAMALHCHPEFLYRQLGEAATGDKEAQKLVADVACDVFGVMAFDGTNGLTIAERVELMMAFDHYILALKKNTKHSLTLQSSLASTSSESDASTTNGSSVSG